MQAVIRQRIRNRLNDGAPVQQGLKLICYIEVVVPREIPDDPVPAGIGPVVFRPGVFVS